jgi:hypothetical protein
LNGDANIPANDDKFISDLTNEFNDSIVFSPDQLRMAYTIRDPVINSKNFHYKFYYKNVLFKNFIITGVFDNETNRGFANKYDKNAK